MKKQLNKYLMRLFVVTMSVVDISTVNASVKVTLIDGKKFTDFEMSNQSRAKRLQILQRDLTKLYSELATQYLSNNESLDIDVTNVDLPGIYHFAALRNHENIRVWLKD